MSENNVSFKKPGAYETICVQIAQLLQEVYDESFIDHMNKYDLWKKFDDKDYMEWVAELDIPDIINQFKGGLSDLEISDELAQYNKLMFNAKHDPGVDIVYETQDIFTCWILSRDLGISYGEAIRRWFSSKTRGLIHNKVGVDLTNICPAQCAEEYKLEVSNDPYWFLHTF